MATADDVEDLRDLLRRLRAEDIRLRVFGSEHHGYRLGSTLSEAELAAFETAHDIRLPEDYRLFLATVGNGGAGPFYGLEPLGALGHDLSQPFPLTQSTEQLDAEEWDRLLVRDEWPGVLEFCHQGSGIYAYLVVNGPTYGTIWDGREEFYPTGRTFAGWYRRWLERALLALENERLVPRLRVGMSKDEVPVAVGGDWRVRPSLIQSARYFEAADFPARLELDEHDVVVKIKPWPFISARPS